MPNYLPLSQVPVGTIVRELDTGAMAMKPPQHTAVFLLESVYLKGRLLPRGTLLPMHPNEAVELLDKIDAVQMPVNRVDPRDPSKQYWELDALVDTGNAVVSKVRPFAGLFLYSGLGMGYYYSSQRQEKVWTTEMEGRKLALEQGVSFVYHDKEVRTTDAELASRRLAAAPRLTSAKAA